MFGIAGRAKLGRKILAFITQFAFFCILIKPIIAETIQLVQQSGEYLVPVQINGLITLPFLLDSGATSVVLPVDVFLTLTRTGTVRESDFIGTRTVILADGSKRQVRVFTLRQLRVGDHIISNVVASVSPVRGDPLLGQSFLSRLPAWTIDNQRHALVLNDHPGSVAVQQTAMAKLPAPAPGRLTPPNAPETASASTPEPNLSVRELEQRGRDAITAKKYSEALRWFRMAADQGSGFAQYNIGFLYMNGWGVTQNYAEAMRWFRMAADQGITAAESNIGWMVARGEGVTKDCSIARQWLEKAAAAGDASAKNNLGNGVNGACPWGIIR